MDSARHDDEGMLSMKPSTNLPLSREILALAWLGVETRKLAFQEGYH